MLSIKERIVWTTIGLGVYLSVTLVLGPLWSLNDETGSLLADSLIFLIGAVYISSEVLFGARKKRLRKYFYLFVGVSVMSVIIVWLAYLKGKFVPLHGISNIFFWMGLAALDCTIVYSISAKLESDAVLRRNT